MAVERLSNVKDYYRRITEIDIGAVAREFLGSRVMHESDHWLSSMITVQPTARGLHQIEDTPYATL